MDMAYTCKWFAPLSEVHIEEPDYHAADVWDKALLGHHRRNNNNGGRIHVSVWSYEIGVGFCVQICMSAQSDCLTNACFAIDNCMFSSHAQDVDMGGELYQI